MELDKAALDSWITREQEWGDECVECGCGECVSCAEDGAPCVNDEWGCVECGCGMKGDG